LPEPFPPAQRHYGRRITRPQKEKMKMKRLLIASMLIAVVLLTACGAAAPA
jgi:hypothetical protein